MSLLASFVAHRGSWSVSGELTVAPGEVLAITGPNGVGKSTLVHAVAGLVETTGSITLGGQELVTLPVERRRLGVVFQDRRLPPWLTALGAASMGSDRAGAHDWLDRLQVADQSRTRVSRLSGGQAQRVALARALSGVRRALLLDEPFQALDASSVQAVRDLVLRHARETHLPVVLVTHNDDDLAAADRVLRL